jgi:hypothetical protein
LTKKDRYKRKPVEPPKKVVPRQVKGNYSKTEGIDQAEIRRRRETGECLRCAWPSDRKGYHQVADCKRPIKLDKGTANFPKAKEYIIETSSSEESSDDSL